MPGNTRTCNYLISARSPCEGRTQWEWEASDESIELVEAGLALQRILVLWGAGSASDFAGP
eukprot:1159652-Pelagomonas_calceolata.AAC.17